MVLLITGLVQRQLFIYVNSYFYTFALLNVLNWARTGSFTQSLSAADLGYGLWIFHFKTIISDMSANSTYILDELCPPFGSLK
jgi:hypothetical protein